jgi:hypothetical protein
VLLGFALAYDLRGLGRRAVRLMFAHSPYKRIAAGRERFFYTGWGIVAGAFGLGALAIAVLHRWPAWPRFTVLHTNLN